MDEQSIWKKEISFGRKKAPKAPPEPGEERTSIWKKEIGFKKKSKAEQTEKPKTAAQSPAEPKQSIWKKEISFGKKAKAEAPAAQPPVGDSGPGEGVRGDREASPATTETPTQPITVAPEALAAPPAPVVPEPASAEATPAPVVPAPEPAPVFRPAVAEAPEPAAQPPVRDSGPGEGVWGNREVSPATTEAPVQPEAAPPVIQIPIPPTTTAVPSPPPAPAPQVVHPPVPAAALPPEPKDEKSVPFWKRDIAIGRRGAAKEPAGEKALKQKRTKTPKVKADRGGKGKKVVGLKIGASQLAAARVSNNGAAELLQVAREPLSPGIIVGGELRDPDALALALKDFFAKHKLPKRGVRLGLANNRIGVRTFDVEGIDDPKQLDNAIRFRAQETLPIPIDEAVLDYQVLGESANEAGKVSKRVLLVVAYREQIDRYAEACKKAGIVLLGIDLEAFALLRALQAPQSGAGDDPDAALVAVAIGHERSTFAVSDGRVCEFTRVLEWGGSAINVALARTLDAAPSEVEGIKRALSLMDEMTPEGLTPEQAAKAREAIRRAIQTFARELVSSLQYYQNQPGSLGIGEIVLTGGTTHLPGLAAELERLIGVRVRVGDPLARTKVSKKIGQPEQIGSLAVAIGLGIED
ncbi:MAG: type IV pilus assembly protein PilM [Actinobacteria bacterium]|nr:MAG: type IV pilus assembly protein PilM [Actinomycetota bacterium]